MGDEISETILALTGFVIFLTLNLIAVFVIVRMNRERYRRDKELFESEWDMIPKASEYEKK